MAFNTEATGIVDVLVDLTCPVTTLPKALKLSTELASVKLPKKAKLLAKDNTDRADCFFIKFQVAPARLHKQVPLEPNKLRGGVPGQHGAGGPQWEM